MSHLCVPLHVHLLLEVIWHLSCDAYHKSSKTKIRHNAFYSSSLNSCPCCSARKCCNYGNNSKFPLLIKYTVHESYTRPVSAACKQNEQQSIVKLKSPVLVCFPRISGQCVDWRCYEIGSCIFTVPLYTLISTLMSL